MLEFLLERWPLLMLGAMLSVLALCEGRGWLMTRYWSWRVARTHRHAAEILSNYRSLLRACTGRRRWLVTLQPRPWWARLLDLWSSRRQSSGV